MESSILPSFRSANRRKTRGEEGRKKGEGRERTWAKGLVATSSSTLSAKEKKKIKGKKGKKAVALATTNLSLGAIGRRGGGKERKKKRLLNFFLFFRAERKKGGRGETAPSMRCPEAVFPGPFRRKKRRRRKKAPFRSHPSMQAARTETGAGKGRWGRGGKGKKGNRGEVELRMLYALHQGRRFL